MIASPNRIKHELRPKTHFAKLASLEERPRGVHTRPIRTFDKSPLSIVRQPICQLPLSASSTYDRRDERLLPKGPSSQPGNSQPVLPLPTRKLPVRAHLFISLTSSNSHRSQRVLLEETTCERKQIPGMFHPLPRGLQNATLVHCYHGAWFTLFEGLR